MQSDAEEMTRTVLETLTHEMSDAFDMDPFFYIYRLEAGVSTLSARSFSLSWRSCCRYLWFWFLITHAFLFRALE